MPSHFYALSLGILVVWRFAHLLYAEDGPWDLMVRLRRAAGEGFLARLLDCFYCLSLWISPPFAFLLGDGLTERLLLWPALSAGAIILERITVRPEIFPDAFVAEDKENDHVLRHEQDATEKRKPPSLER
jgi:hypothetical protein